MWVFMRRYALFAFFCCFVALSPGLAHAASGSAAEAVAQAPPPVLWQDLEPGLALAQIPLQEARPFLEPKTPALPVSDNATIPAPALTPGPVESSPPPMLIALRIDPERYTLTLHMASSDQPRSLPDLAARHHLSAAINASMYLPDKRTSTGHMRNATHVNNPRVVEKFGAFLVTQPKVPGLPRALLLDRAEDDWQTALERYSLVIQNYRLNNVQGKVLWSSEGPPHSIAALSQNKAGQLFFLLCPDPVQPALFAAALLHLPLGLRTVMYLEGGSQAALLVKAGGVEQVWVGRHASGLWGTSGRPDAALPNVLGIRPRAVGE